MDNSVETCKPEVFPKGYYYVSAVIDSVLKKFTKIGMTDYLFVVQVMVFRFIQIAP